MCATDAKRLKVTCLVVPRRAFAGIGKARSEAGMDKNQILVRGNYPNLA